MINWFKRWVSQQTFQPTDNAGRVCHSIPQTPQEAKGLDIKERVARNNPKLDKAKKLTSFSGRVMKFVRLLADGHVLTNLDANEMHGGTGDRELQRAVEWLELRGVRVRKVQRRDSKVVNKYLEISEQQKARTMLGVKKDIKA